MRPAAVFILFAACAAAVAAPVPKGDPGPLAKLYGTPVDPDKDCTFTLNDQLLTIGIPAKHHTLTTTPTARTAPRVLHDVTGDFTAVVRVTVTFPADPKSDIPMLDPASGAGLIVWKDNDNYACLEQVHELLGGMNKLSDPEFHTVVGGDEGESASGRPVPFDPTPIFLKLERKGDVVRGFASGDGEVWRLVGRSTLKFGPKVQVGVFAGHNAGGPVTATFDKYSLK